LNGNGKISDIMEEDEAMAEGWGVEKILEIT